MRQTDLPRANPVWYHLSVSGTVGAEYLFEVPAGFLDRHGETAALFVKLRGAQDRKQLVAGRILVVDLPDFDQLAKRAGDFKVVGPAFDDILIRSPDCLVKLPKGHIGFHPGGEVPGVQSFYGFFFLLVQSSQNGSGQRPAIRCAFQRDFVLLRACEQGHHIDAVPGVGFRIGVVTDLILVERSLQVALGSLRARFSSFVDITLLVNAPHQAVCFRLFRHAGFRILNKLPQIRFGTGKHALID